jgi:hypothetical protein
LFVDWQQLSVRFA